MRAHRPHRDGTGDAAGRAPCGAAGTARVADRGDRVADRSDRPPAGYAYGSKGMPAGLAFARWDAKDPSLRPKCALPKSAWTSWSRRFAG